MIRSSIIFHDIKVSNRFLNLTDIWLYLINLYNPLKILQYILFVIIQAYISNLDLLSFAIHSYLIR